MYIGYIFKFEIPKYKQIIQQKLKLSENHHMYKGTSAEMYDESKNMIHII